MLLIQRQKLPSDDVTDVPMKDICIGAPTVVVRN